jgi:hypothetical protein
MVLDLSIKSRSERYGRKTFKFEFPRLTDVGGVFFVFVYTGSSSYTCIPPCQSADKQLYPYLSLLDLIDKSTTIKIYIYFFITLIFF